MALMDGAFSQLVMLVVYGIISLCAYVIFKVCEKIIVEWLTKPFAKNK
jgi:disulfide oxidoreductase YuzD